MGLRLALAVYVYKPISEELALHPVSLDESAFFI
jgi:hypothetical protein